MKLTFRPRRLRLCWPLIALGLVAARPANSQIMPGFTVAPDDPTPLATALTGFVESGNTWKPLAEGLLAKGARINALDRFGQTPLITVIVSGVTSQKQKVAWLLEHGADVQICANNSQNALEAALSSDSPDSDEIIALVMAKTDVKIRDGNGATPLFAAVKRGDARFVQQILDKGADINAQDSDGNTALHLAAQTPGPMLQMLLKLGGRTDLKNRRGDLPLHIALRLSQNGTNFTSRETLYASAPLPAEKAPPLDAQLLDTLVAPLIAQSDVNSRDASDLSPLILAILARDQELRDLILARRPKLDDATRFFDAVSQGDLVTAQNLLGRKPYLVYFRLADGTTPLHVSALWGTTRIAQLLVQKGADINARDSRGQAPLHLALLRPDGIFSRRAKNMLAWLLGKGADVNALGENDASPLHLAARSGDAGLIALLLSHHANINARDAEEQTPIFALMTNHSDLKIVSAFIERGADLNVRPLTGSTLLSYATRTRRLDLVQLLLDKGADVRQRGYRGDTALAVFLAPTIIWSGSATEIGGLVPIATLLLFRGADPNAIINSDSLLTYAVRYNALEIVRLLLDTKKVDLTAGKSVDSPLWMAVTYPRPAAIPLLLAAGADPTERNWKGETLQAAADARGKELGELFRREAAALAKN